MIGLYNSQAHTTWCGLSLCCRVQHIFDEYTISGGGVVDQHVGHGADEFAILNDRAAGHADVK